MERWPWPKSAVNNIKIASNQTNTADTIQMNTSSTATECQCSSNHTSTSTTATAVKLILWPSFDNNSNHVMPSMKTSKVSRESGQVSSGSGQSATRKHSGSRKMWSKLPLRQIPSSIQAKMGWLVNHNSESNSNSNGLSFNGLQGSSKAQNATNAVFRSNSFRFERPPPEDDARMYQATRPVKSFSITAQDVSPFFEFSKM